MEAQKRFKIRLKKGDLVMVRSGKDKGKTGKVLATHPQENKVTVEGINVVKRHVKPNRTHPQGGICGLLAQCNERQLLTDGHLCR